jgi:hypothetical protein
MESKSKVKQWYKKATSGESVAHITRRKAEDFWPTTLDKEAMRAAGTLRSYFMDGFVVRNLQNQHAIHIADTSVSVRLGPISNYE